MSLKFLKPEYRKKQFELAEAVSVSFAFVAPDKEGQSVFAATYELDPPELLAKLRKETGFTKGVAGSLKVRNKTLRLSPLKPFPGLRKAVIALAKAEGWTVRKAAVEGEPEVDEVQSVSSEVVSGSSGFMTSVGGLTETTADLGEDFGEGARENAYFNISGDRGEQQGPQGAVPMQSARRSKKRVFARRHGLGFLCWDYPGTINDLADVKEYKTPGSAYLKAFQGMDKVKQIENPTQMDVVNHVLAAVDDLAAYAFTAAGHEQEWGELVISFQGHGDRGRIVLVDMKELQPKHLRRMADYAEKKQVSLTFVLDGCFTGRAVEAFQNRNADEAERCVAAAENNEAPAAKVAEWKRKMALARRFIKYNRVLGQFADQMSDTAAALGKLSSKETPPPAALERATRTAADAALLLISMRELLAPELANPPPSGPDLAALDLAFANKIKLCQAYKPTHRKSFEDFMGEIGVMQDRVSDTANAYLESVDEEARAAAHAE